MACANKNKLKFFSKMHIVAGNIEHFIKSLKIIKYAENCIYSSFEKINIFGF